MKSTDESSAALCQVGQQHNRFRQRGQLIAAEIEPEGKSDENGGRNDTVNVALGQIDQLPNTAWKKGQMVMIEMEPMDESDEHSA